MDGLFTFAATRGEIELSFTVDKSKLTETMIERLVERGIMEDIRNSWASVKTDDPKAAELSQAAGQKWIDRVHAGELPTGGRGGPRLSPFQKALRQVIAAWLVDKHSFTPSDAEKAARTPAAIVKEKALEASERTGRDVKELIESTMAKFDAQAEKLAAMRVTEEVEM